MISGMLANRDSGKDEDRCVVQLSPVRLTLTRYFREGISQFLSYSRLAISGCANSHQCVQVEHDLPLMSSLPVLISVLRKRSERREESRDEVVRSDCTGLDFPGV